MEEAVVVEFWGYSESPHKDRIIRHHHQKPTDNIYNKTRPVQHRIKIAKVETSSDI